MTDSYATREEFFRFGARGGEIVNQGRLATSEIGSDAFTLDLHGFVTGSRVMLRAESGGALPAPLVAGTTQYVIADSESTFRVAATSGGAAIDLTTVGVAVVVTTPLPIDEYLEAYSRWVDNFIPGEFLPLLPPYPLPVVMAVCLLAKAALLRWTGQVSESMKDEELGEKAKLERWAKGLGVAGVATSANLAYGESFQSDIRGWGGGGTLV